MKNKQLIVQKLIFKEIIQNNQDFEINKKEKCKEECLSYMENKFDGDDTKEKGVSKKKRNKNMKNQ